MNISEISKPITSARLNESLAKKFGTKIDLSKFSLTQLEDARNRLRTQLSQVETNESFDAVHSASYQKSKMFLDVLNAAISECDGFDKTAVTNESVVTEGAEDSAELVMAAKDMVDRVTGWMEDTAEMQTESMLELADAIRDEMGSEQSEAFVNAVKPALEALYAAMETTRTSLIGGVGIVTGEGAPETMGAAEPEMDMEPTVDADAEEVPAEDEFAAAEPAAGGEEEAGRATRESINRQSKKK